MTPPPARLVTARLAATLAHRRPATVRWWAHRGWLTPTGRDAHGYPLYDVLDVWRCERAVRARGRGRPRRTA